MQRMEEIGKEDAWFKSDKNQISVAPGGRWSRFKAYSTIQRTLEIWGFFLKFIVKAWLDNQKFTYRGGMTEEKKVLRRKALAKWLKENILRLGPTFIKIGQQFSTRVDILLQEYVDQLSELQDQVPPFPSETAVYIVKEELGVPLDDIFDRFDNEPIAAASLGQAHRARLKGQEVVVKVQRPGLKDLFDTDLKNLRVIAEYLQKVDPKSDDAKRDWEIDYTKEAANAEVFASNFKNMDYIKVPEVLWDYSTPQVLTMEYVPGIKINKIQALDQLGIGRVSVRTLERVCLKYSMEFMRGIPIRFREVGIEVIVKDFEKRWNRQSSVFYNLFRQADRVEKLAKIIDRLEQGDLKLRVRTLESERAFQCFATVQKTIGSAVAAGTLVNLATILYINSIRVPAIIAYTFCAIFGFQVLFGIIKVKKLDERERLMTGTA